VRFGRLSEMGAARRSMRHLFQFWLKPSWLELARNRITRLIVVRRQRRGWFLWIHDRPN
jgi:hypothetical protein